MMSTNGMPSEGDATHERSGADRDAVTNERTDADRVAPDHAVAALGHVAVFGIAAVAAYTYQVEWGGDD